MLQIVSNLLKALIRLVYKLMRQMLPWPQMATILDLPSQMLPESLIMPLASFGPVSQMLELRQMPSRGELLTLQTPSFQAQ
jgi:hypothetical protein